MSVFAQIAAATAAGDVEALAALAMELASKVAGLEALAEHDEQRRARQAERTRRHRNSTSRDVTLQGVTVTHSNTPQDSPPPAGKEKGFICPPQEPPNGAARETPATPTPVTGKSADKPSRLPRLKRPAQEPAPWMGLMAKAWTLGTLPPGSATLLRPVVAELGPEETADRLARYCQRADGDFASVRQFVEKHGRYAAAGPALVAAGHTPDSRPRQLRATEQLLV